MAEEVAHTAGADADEHLDEVAARHREEGDVGLAGYGFGQQRLTRSRRTDEQRALGNFAAQVGIFLGVLEEIDNLLHLLLGALLSGDVLERDVDALAFFKEAGLALAHAEDAARGTAATAHLAHEQEPQADEQEDGQQTAQQVHEETVRYLVRELYVARFDIFAQTVQVVRTLRDDRRLLARAVHALIEDAANLVRLGLDHEAGLAVALVDDDLLGVAFLNVTAPLRQAHLLADAAAVVVAHEEHEPQAHDHSDVEPVEVEAWHIVLLVFLILCRHDAWS